jgi:hypothetical protein
MEPLNGRPWGQPTSVHSSAILPLKSSGTSSNCGLARVPLKDYELEQRLTKTLTSTDMHVSIIDTRVK